jgi:hypothetical protein
MGATSAYEALTRAEPPRARAGLPAEAREGAGRGHWPRGHWLYPCASPGPGVPAAQSLQLGANSRVRTEGRLQKSNRVLVVPIEQILYSAIHRKV